MRYSDLHVGLRVLLSPCRTSSPRFSLSRATEVVVIGTGVPLQYRVTGGGWDRTSTMKSTTRGVRVRRGDGSETVTIAAFLVSLDEKVTEAWEKVKEEQRKRLDAAELAAAERSALEDRFAAVGVAVSVGRDLQVTMSRLVAEEALALMEKASGLEEGRGTEKGQE